MKNLIKLDTQNGYKLWKLEIAGDTVYNVTRENEDTIPNSGYFNPEYLEHNYPVIFPKG